MRAAASPLRGGASPMRGLQDYSSTSTLLQEITTLRSRLKDLEDDTKSSVIGPAEQEDSPLVAIMKKDVAKLEEEKAMQEKDFLNQMTSLQVESKKQVDAWKERLEQAEKEQQSLAKKLDESNKENSKLSEKLQIPTDAESYARKLEDVRDIHSKEMEQMKTNLISADREISESRAEIDALQEELFEMQNHRHELLDEVTSIRMELADEQRRTEEVASELSEAKVLCENAQSELKKNVPTAEKASEENAKLRQLAAEAEGYQHTLDNQKDRIERQEDEIARLREAVVELETSKGDTAAESEDCPISLTEKAQLLQNMQEIESRLARFHTRLAEKDSKIDSLAEALAKERSSSKNGGEPKKRGLKSSSPPGMTNQPITAPPEVKRTTELDANGSPRTPVAGIVASFERRMGGVGPTGARCVSDDDDDDIQGNLQQEKYLITDLQEQLRLEREKIADLEAQILNDTDRSELDRLRSESVYLNVLREDLERKLQQDNQERKDSTARGLFQEEKKDGEEDYLQLQEALTSTEQAMEALELDFNSYKIDTEQVLERLRSQVEGLEAELDKALNKVETLEHQLQESNEKVYSLESNDLDHTMEKARHAEIVLEHETARSNFENTISRLESQKTSFEDEVTELKEKLAASQADHAVMVQQLEDQATNLERSLDIGGESSTSQKLNEADQEINRLTVETTKLRVSMADMERTYLDNIKGIEREMALIEAEADQELDAKQQVIQDMTRKLAAKEEAIDRMEEEKCLMRSSVASASTGRKDEMEELQSELLDMTSKNRDQSREIMSLRSRIDEVDSSKDDRFVQQQHHVRNLEDEIERLYSEGRRKNSKESTNKLQSENHQLRETLREMKLERRQWKDRLDSGSEKVSSRSSQILRERNAKLKQEVEKLTRRLKKLEDSITRVAV